LAKTSSVGQQIWIEARKENDYQKFAPILGEILELKREQADAIGFADCRYDAMLDDYEPGVVTRDVEQVLNDLRTELVPLVQQIGECSGPAPTNIVDRDFPIAIQREIGRMAAEKIGFDFNRGRIDVAAHPFCTTLGPRDIRLTTRFDRKHFNGAFFGTLHEAGHGIYEQGLPEEHFGLPPGSYCSLGIHESQSRMWENLVGRSHGFWEYFYPTVQKKFADSLGNVAQDDFVAAINQCAPSLIRVEADEATYNLHIIIRFELEKSLIENQLSVNDLPEAWNQKYEQYLGIRPAGDANGVLQDVHWSAGLIGYFPTYSLGNVFASQFFAAAEKELGDLEPPFRKGDFESLKNWLNANIHQLGGRYRSYDLVKKITGTGVDHRDLIAHLKSKFGRFYGIAV
jgi:carboxypeptidase Taq